MPTPQVDKLVNDLLKTLPRVKDLAAAYEEVRKELDDLMPGLSEKLAAELKEAREIVAWQFENIEILHHHSVIRKRSKWYFGPKPADLHWPAVKAYMSNSKGWNEEDVKNLDEASNEIVSLLDNPNQPSFSCRGMVVGHVQAGKTANMTAVIAKALDAGYDVAIVLAGLTNKLRYQTQLRLYEDLVQRNPLCWQVLTANEISRDFRAPPHGGFLSHSDKAQIAIIKKNVSPLRELKEAISRTPPIILNRLRILVIDDECDQASVNSAQGELDMTAINQRIREILSMLPAVTYIGYTATPFANVLINPYRADGQQLDDLYPREFITALPRSKNYFGTEKLFGLPPFDAGDPLPEEEGLDMIRTVTEKEEAGLQPKNRKDRDTFQPQITESLKKAILYFLGCCAVRRARGDQNKHMTMLVHTSAYISAHERLASLIHGWVDVNGAKLLDSTSDIRELFEKIWAEEKDRLPADITNAPPASLQEIYSQLPSVLNALEFPVENGASDDRIDYVGRPRTYIVVGGSILARGLTLEGLMVSYFLRTANQYDTLLQMGRWFGYRPNYEDLPRIWMPEDLQLKFRALASVEREIREDIEAYRARDLTPMDIAVRIRALPGMAITAATKMKAARECAVSYWGTHKQTFRFEHQNNQLLSKNWQAAAELVSRAESLGLREPTAGSVRKKLWSGVPKSSIVRFFETYIAHSTHADMDPRMLLPFIQKADARLDSWNVGIVESTRGTLSENPLGVAGPVKLITRARLRGSENIADIKALMSKHDIWFDCEQLAPKDADWRELKAARVSVLGQKPLLLLYPIDKVSEPSKSRERVALNAAHDILGYGVVFPGSIAEGGNYVSVELQMLSADEIAEIDMEEQAQAEAAGVK